MADQSFNGFGNDTFSFLQELRDNNNREWFADNRSRYDEHFLAPAFALVNALEDVARKLSPPHKAEARINGSVRRINRDVRFSKDKSPYSARMHLVFWTGDHPNRSAATHFVLHPEGIGYGVGQWGLTPDQLDIYRRQISDTSVRAEFMQVLNQAEALGCTMGKPALKRTPKGFDAPEEWADLLKHKSLVARTMDDVAVPEALKTSEGVDFVADLLTRLAPFNGWVRSTIG